IQDSRGFIWIGTQSGLNKYDGYKFTSYKYNPDDTNSISNNYIYSICEDRNGDIWIGTKDGLSKYVYSENKFYNFFSDDNNSELDDNKIFSLILDSKGYIWFKSISHLSKINTANYSARHFRHYNNIFSFISDNVSFPILEDNNGNIWVGTEDGLNFFDRELEIFKRYYHIDGNYKSLKSNKIRSIFEDSNNNIFVGTDVGLSKFISKTQNFKNFENRKEICVNDIYENELGKIILGTDNGIKIFDNNKEKNYYKESSYEGSLAKSTINSIIKDNSGILWIGSLEGLFRVKKSKKQFNLYSKTPKGIPLFSNNHIASIYIENNVLFVGTRGGGLHKYNRKTKQLTKYTSKNTILDNDFIYELFKDSKNRLWIGTQNGVYYFETNRNNIQAFPRLEFENNRVYEIFEDSKSNLWYCTDYGLYKYSDNKLESFFHNSSNQKSISSNLVYTITEDNNEYWIGTDNGLNKLDKQSYEFSNCKKQIGKENRISSNEVISLHKDLDNSNILWIGTLYGLNKYNKKENKFVAFLAEDGLPDNVIYSIVENGDNNLWLSTNRGISQFNKDKLEFINFGIDDGLQNYEFSIGAYFKSKKGEIFFGGISGINSFFPDSIKINRIPPKMAITEVEIVAKNKKTLKYPS
ncbi:MAG: two-component regulator propeller domain-containing protein, partial [Bacteroidota bacterium]|nr:two-component regulator propeller domain-containing protein [Bacteroidota bacterium]